MFCHRNDQKCSTLSCLTAACCCVTLVKILSTRARRSMFRIQQRRRNRLTETIIIPTRRLMWWTRWESKKASKLLPTVILTLLQATSFVWCYPGSEFSRNSCTQNGLGLMFALLLCHVHQFRRKQTGPYNFTRRRPPSPFFIGGVCLYLRSTSNRRKCAG